MTRAETGARRTSTVLCVVGARPNFMKIAPIMAAFEASARPLRARLLHTGQHYDAVMNQQYFDALGIRPPDINLGVGSGSHAGQTAEIMARFEAVLDSEHPDLLLVVGDVNSTLACSLVAAKCGVPVAHVEAGLRSFDRTMPEEINRVLTDQLASLLFTTEPEARDNLQREGIDADRIHFVGNVMIDTLHHQLPHAVDPAVWLEACSVPAARIAGSEGYALLTLHRPANVDDPAVAQVLLETIATASRRIPVLFPVHPRTRARLGDAALSGILDDSGVIELPPAGYLEMLGLMRDARLVLTDSGGVQEETTALGTPCITLRDNTERPVTVSEGTNTVVGRDPARILDSIDETLTTGGKRGRVPAYWDGQAAERIVDVLGDWLVPQRRHITTTTVPTAQAAGR